MTIPRAEIIKRLQAQIAAGRPVVAAGAGTGLSAQSQEAGGVDLIIVYNSGRYRMAGHSSLAGLFAYGDANAMVVEMAREILPAVRHTPVLAGVNATDPFRQMPIFLNTLHTMGFSGVKNFPTVGLFDGIMRATMEAVGLSYAKEVDMIALAHRMDLFTAAYVFTPEEAAAMAGAGADVIIPHVGLTVVNPASAAVALSLDAAIEKVMMLAAAAHAVRRDVVVLCHGGPFDEPENVGQALARMPGIAGFCGAAHVEQQPAARAIAAQVGAFKALRLAGRADEAF